MSGKLGYGTVLVIGGTTPGGLDTIAGPNITIETVETTAMDSTDATKECIAGLIDSGEVSADGNFIKADFLAILTLLKARAEVACTITLPSALGAFSFQGIVTEVSYKTATKDKVTATYKVKVTGVVTFA